MNITELAVAIGEVQSGLATGELTGLTAQEELNKIKKQIVESGRSSAILDGYRKDAIGHLVQIRELLSAKDLQTIPDMELFHLCCLCELSAFHTRHYFNLRNDHATRNIQFNSGGE